MYKKIFSAILFGVLTIASTSTFVSCKDYDDDIKNLQEQINDLVNTKIATINTTITTLQTNLTAIENAYKAADTQLENGYKEGDKQTLASAKALIEDAITKLQTAHDKDVATLTAKDAEFDKAIVAANQQIQDILKLLSDQNGNLVQVGKDLKTLSDKLSDFESEYGTLSTAFGELTTRVTNLEDAVKAQKAALDELAKAIGNGTNPTGIDDATLKADIAKAGERIDALEKKISDLDTKLTKQINDAVTTVNGKIDGVNTDLQGLKAEYASFSATVTTQIADLNTSLNGVKAQAEATAADLGKLDVMFSILVSDLRSLVYMPKLYVDGIETIEYPYLRYALQYCSPGKYEKSRKEADIPADHLPQYLRDLHDYNRDGHSDSTFFTPAWPLEYHMNPANAQVEFSDIQGYYVYNAEVMTRAFYDTKANIASTYGIVQADRWDNWYNTEDLFYSTKNGILTVGLQLWKNEANGALKSHSGNDTPNFDDKGASYFPSDVTEDQDYPYTAKDEKNIILALQAKSSLINKKDTTITSDYAQLLPEKIKLEGIIWNTHPTYWDGKNERIKDFWENKKGYGTMDIAGEGSAYKYRPGGTSATAGRDEAGDVCGQWIHVWDKPEEALLHPADIEVFIDQEVNLSQYLGVHYYYEQNYPLTDNVRSHKPVQKWAFGAKEMERLGLVWVFDTLDYYVSSNQTHDSRYIRFTDHKLGKLVSANVTEVGATYEDQTHTAVGREPLVRVRLYHISDIGLANKSKWDEINTVDGNKEPQGGINWFNHKYPQDEKGNLNEPEPIFDGYIRLHITRPELLPIEYPTENATFNLCNGITTNKNKIGGWNWSMFNDRVLKNALNNMEKAQFDLNYRPEIDEAAGNSVLPDGGHRYELAQYNKAGSPNADNPDEHYYYSKVQGSSSQIGHIFIDYDNAGTTNHDYIWSISAEELEALTHHATGDNGNNPATVTRYIHYTGHFYSSSLGAVSDDVRPQFEGADYDDIFIKLTIVIKRKDVPVSETKSKIEQYWYREDGSWRNNMTPNDYLPIPSAYGNSDQLSPNADELYRSISNNTVWPENDGRTVPWRNYILRTWDGNKVNVSNATGGSKFYFAPIEYDITALDGTVYTITPRRGSGDNIYNKFICKYIANNSHAYLYDATNPFNSTKLAENNDILNKCAIRYQPDVAGIQMAYGMNVATVADPSAWPKADGVFSNDTLYAYRKSPNSEASKTEYEPIAIMSTSTSTGGEVVLLHEYVENKWLDGDYQPSGSKYTLGDEFQKENAYAEACVNAVGYLSIIERDATTGLMTGEFEDKGNPLDKQLRSYVGVIATSECNIANQMKDYKIGNFAVFQMAWERPINMLQEADFVIDAVNNGDYIYMVDIIKLFDWRGVNEGHMWGDTPNYWGKTWEPWQWLWAYYNVKSITYDLSPNVVKTNLSQTNPNTIVTLSSVSNEVQLRGPGGARNKITTVVSTSNPNLPLRTAPTDFNANTKNQDLIDYMGLNNPYVEPGPDPDKAKFGYIKYTNNYQNVDDFDIWLPVSVQYDWGTIALGDWDYDVKVNNQPKMLKIHIHYTRGN